MVLSSTVVFMTGAPLGIGAATADIRRPNPLCDSMHASLTQPGDGDTVVDRLRNPADVPVRGVLA